MMCTDCLGKILIILNNSFKNKYIKKTAFFILFIFNYIFKASYGSLARFRNVERMIKVGDSTVIGASGDISDFQYITYLMDKLM